MSRRLTETERAYTRTAGACTRCGIQERAGYRNSAGECGACHNLAYREYRARRRAWLEEQREHGREEWAKLGIAEGDAVWYSASWVFAGPAARGTARVGACGAYVHIRRDPSKYAPGNWRKATESGYPRSLATGRGEGGGDDDGIPPE